MCATFFACFLCCVHVCVVLRDYGTCGLAVWVSIAYASVESAPCTIIGRGFCLVCFFLQLHCSMSTWLRAPCSDYMRSCVGR